MEVDKKIIFPTLGPNCTEQLIILLSCHPVVAQQTTENFEFFFFFFFGSKLFGNE
jgi:hypothetical protein